MSEKKQAGSWEFMFHGVDEAELLLRTEQVSEMLSQSKNTLEHWRLKGEGPPFMKVGRSVRYRLSEVHKWISSQKSYISTSDFDSQ